MVRKNQRSTSRFETLDKALELVTYTTNIIDNDKIFDKKHQRTIDRISEEVTMIYHFCRVANNIRVNDYKAETEKVIQRIKLESEALELCEALLTDIMISHKLFINRIKMDVGTAKDVENAIANADNEKAFQDYIIACDHPELLEDMEENEDE